MCELYPASYFVIRLAPARVAPRGPRSTASARPSSSTTPKWTRCPGQRPTASPARRRRTAARARSASADRAAAVSASATSRTDAAATASSKSASRGRPDPPLIPHATSPPSPRVSLPRRAARRSNVLLRTCLGLLVERTNAPSADPRLGTQHSNSHLIMILRVRFHAARPGRDRDPHA